MNVPIILIGSMLIMAGIFAGGPFNVGLPITPVGDHPKYGHDIGLQITNLQLQSGNVNAEFNVDYRNVYASSRGGSQAENFNGHLNIKAGYIPDGKAKSCSNIVQSLSQTNLPTFKERDLVVTQSTFNNQNDYYALNVGPDISVNPTQTVTIMVCAQMIENFITEKGKTSPFLTLDDWDDPMSDVYEWVSRSDVTKLHRTIEPNINNEDEPIFVPLSLILCDKVTPCDALGYTELWLPQQCDWKQGTGRDACISSSTALKDSGSIQINPNGNKGLGALVHLNAFTKGQGEFVHWKCEGSCHGWTSEETSSAQIWIKGTATLTAVFKSPDNLLLSVHVEDGQELGKVEIQNHPNKDSVEVAYGSKQTLIITPNSQVESEQMTDFPQIYELKIKRYVEGEWNEIPFTLEPDDICSQRDETLYAEISGGHPCGQIDVLTLEVDMLGDTKVHVKFGQISVSKADGCPPSGCAIPPAPDDSSGGFEISKLHLVVMGVILLVIGMWSHVLPFSGRRR